MGSRIEGLADLARSLREMPQDVRRNALRSGMRAGAREIQKDAQRRAPVDTGRMRTNVYLKRIPELVTELSEGWFVGVRMGPKRTRDKATGAVSKDYSRDAWYWRLVEFGTRFVPARPFMRPAFESQKEAAVAAIAARLKARIEKWAGGKS